MERSDLEKRLKLANAHVELGRHHVERQAQIVADFERNGHDTGGARGLLSEFQDSLSMHVRDRDRLLRQLAALPPALITTTLD